jgi:Flp pilus assembly protein TadG
MTGRAAWSTAGRTVPTAPARRSPLADDAGAVTVEAALALCALTVFLVLALGALVAVAQTMRCADAARELARLAARGEPDRGRPSPAASHRPARDWS